MIWEIYQQGKISQAKDAADNARNLADRAKSTADRHASDINNILQKLELLSISCQAMWELLRDHSGLTEEHIEAKVLEIDTRDGIVDGKISQQPITCPACGRPSNSRRTICVICGAELSKMHKFGL